MTPSSDHTLRIGAIDVGVPMVLAPMADVTNAPFRRACRLQAQRALAELAGSFLICFAIYVVCSLGSSIYGLNMAFIAAGVALAYGAVTWMLGSVSGVLKIGRASCRERV